MRRQDKADAGWDSDIKAVDLKRLCDRGDNPRCERADLVGMLGLGLDDDKFVAAYTGREVAFAELTFEPASDGFQ